jgi:hypothetical protein
VAVGRSSAAAAERDKPVEALRVAVRLAAAVAVVAVRRASPERLVLPRAHQALRRVSRAQQRVPPVRRPG